MVDMMKLFVGTPIASVPLKSKRLFTRGGLTVFQGKNGDGERLPYYWVQTADGEVVFASERLVECVSVAFEE